MFDHIWRKTQNLNPGLAQLVARLLWEQDVGSSSLPSRTKIPLKSLISEGFFLLVTETTGSAGGGTS